MTAERRTGREYAARGPAGRLWPWGDDWNPHRAASAEHRAGRAITNGPTWRTWWAEHHAAAQLPSTSAVGTPAGGESCCGAADMAGNVQKWTASTYQPYDPTRTCGELYDHLFGIYKILRGGGWTAFRFQIRAVERIAAGPQYSNFTTGFRCAVDLAPAKSAV
ncbi:formylglycine-generating enzyme family protein [Kitasatospora sp. HPMI-4]|uniref:formylglycine-generating enzyme family protein n=1 Tax=Kitasatospora sp. HPMI-4 TaxID=3448443 RepID=UPI003F1E1545